MRPTKGLPYPPIHPDAYRARIETLQAYRAWLADPVRHPAPDLDRLLPHAEHGSITRIEPPWEEGRPIVGVWFDDSKHGTKARWFDLGDFLALDLALAFGGGFTLYDNGDGLSYAQLIFNRPAKRRKLHVLRLLTNAGEDEVAKQHPEDGSRTDYHDYRRRGLSVEPVETVRQSGKRTRTPQLGRPALFEAAAAYFELHHGASGILTTLEAHLAAIRLAFKLEDRQEARRRAALGSHREAAE